MGLKITSQNSGPILGIDLGTTNSLVAVSVKNGSPQILKDRLAPSGLIPSVIYWAEGSVAPIVGNLARPQRVKDTNHTVFSVKRFIGRGTKDVESIPVGFRRLIDWEQSNTENLKLKLGDKSFSPIELSAEILKTAKRVAENALGESVSRAVITVPAYFNDSQRTATKAAGRLAGLDVVRIINEPTAAALAYGLHKRGEELIAVYDLGGGTFDISILRVKDGVFEVLATNGDTSLGGDDFDYAISTHWQKKFLQQAMNADAFLSHDLQAKLLDLAEVAKQALTKSPAWSGSFTHDNHSYPLALGLEEFNQLIEPWVSKTLAITQSAIRDARLDISQIHEVILVGGSTRSPIIQDKVSEFFKLKVNTSLNPDEVVALGAAIQGAILAGENQEMILVDVVPLSLGIETFGGTVSRLVHRNSKIPCVAKETFTTHAEGQKNVAIHVVQGERELVQDCRSLARFDLRGLPPMPAGLPKIEVTFLIDANGILTVKAEETTTGTRAEIDVKPSYGLTDAQVEKMLEDSFAHASDDLNARQWIEAKVEAEGVLVSAEKLLAQCDANRRETLKAQIADGIEHVKSAMASEDHVLLRKRLDELEAVARPMVELVMNQAVKNALVAKNAEEVLKP